MKKLILLAAVIITLASTELFALALSGTFKDVSGNVTIIRYYDKTKNRIAVLNESIVFEGDTITTDNNSSCDIYWTDKVYTRLGPNTEINVQCLAGANEKALLKSQQLNINIKLISGILRNKLRKLNTKSETFKVTTPVSVVAVRGTDFTTSHSNNQTSVNVGHGSVNVVDMIKNKQQTVSQGQSLTVTASAEQIEQIQKSGVVPTLEFDNRGLNTTPGALDKIINTPTIQNLQNLENNIIPQETILNLRGTF